MPSNRLNKTIKANIMATSTFLLLYTALYGTGLWTLQIVQYAMAVTFFYILISFLTLKWNKLFVILPFLMNFIMISLLALGNGNIKITIFLLAPILLAMYYGSKKLTISVEVFSIVVYFLWPLYHCLSMGDKFPECIIKSITATLMYSAEVFGIILIAKRFVKDSELIKKENQVYTDASINSANKTIDTLRTASIYHSQYLTDHSDHVAIYTQIILDEMDNIPKYRRILTPKYKKYIVDGALLHDLGKLWVSDSVLDKTEPLTKEEFKNIMEHPVKGVELFKKLPEGAMSFEESEVIKNIILQHHEKLNGKGYPNHLLKNSISLEAQIVAIADCLDAALSFRTYKQAKDFDTVYIELITNCYEELNQDIVRLLYNRRNEIIALSTDWNETLKKKCLSH